MPTQEARQTFDEWIPGLTSEIPSELMPRVTLFDSENSTVDLVAAKNAKEFCGLKLHELVAFTVPRLIVHETLVRATSDLYVPDGPNYEDLGISLRGMTKRIIEGYINPKLEQLESDFSQLRKSIKNRLKEILDRDLRSSTRKRKMSQKVFYQSCLEVKK